MAGNRAGDQWVDCPRASRVNQPRISHLQISSPRTRPHRIGNLRIDARRIDGLRFVHRGLVRGSRLWRGVEVSVQLGGRPLIGGRAGLFVLYPPNPIGRHPHTHSGTASA